METNSLVNFDSLVERHYQPLFRFAASLCGEPHTALDLTQHTFYLALDRARQIREPSKVKHWLYTILLREFLQKRRREKKFKHHSLDELVTELPGAHTSPARKIDAAAAMRALEQLEERFAVPLRLFYVEDYSYQQIAAHMGIPVGTVMSRLARAKRILRNRLDPRIETEQSTPPDYDHVD